MDAPAGTDDRHDENHQHHSDEDMSDDDNDHDDHEENEEEQNNVESTWDDGGPSDCGYHEQIHSSFMAAGEAVHELVGPPTQPTRTWQTQVGNWFQELSYAARDLLRGEKHLATDAQNAVHELFRGKNGEEDNENGENNHDSGNQAAPNKVSAS